MASVYPSVGLDWMKVYHVFLTYPTALGFWEGKPTGPGTQGLDSLTCQPDLDWSGARDWPPPSAALDSDAGAPGGATAGSLSPAPPSTDINECTSLSEPCRPGFSCINTVGSYTCQRNPVIDLPSSRKAETRESNDVVISPPGPRPGETGTRGLHLGTHKQ